MLHADLKVTSGKQAGSLIQLPNGKFLVGREEDCQLRPNSDLVSRHHCVFTVDQYSVRLRDLGSTNGTLVNGQRIRSTVVLNNGDRVEIGKLEFELVIHQPSGDETTPAMGLNTEIAIPAPAEPAPVSTSETMADFKMPAEVAVPAPNSAITEPAGVAAAAAPGEGPALGDTQYLGMQQPQPQVGYPPNYPGQYAAPPYGYPGYPGMYPQMGYPQMGGMYGQPGMMPPGYPQGYPQQGYAPPGYAQPGYPQQPEESPSAEDMIPKSDVLPVKLPDPETTGAAPVEAKKPGAGGGGKKDEKMGDKAADIIRKYQQRKPI